MEKEQVINTKLREEFVASEKAEKEASFKAGKIYSAHPIQIERYKKAGWVVSKAKAKE